MNQAIPLLNPHPDRPIQTQYLFEADFYQFKHWAFALDDADVPNDGYNDCFCLVFVSQGRFAAKLATQAYDLHTGHVLVEKANYEYRLRPANGACSILNFSPDFYEQVQDEYGLRHSFFFGNSNLLTLGLKTSPAIDYLHYQLWQNGRQMTRLERDQLVLDLVRQVIERMESHSLSEPVSTVYKCFHLTTIEQAKTYLNHEFNRDLTLLDLAVTAASARFTWGDFSKPIRATLPINTCSPCG